MRSERLGGISGVAAYTQQQEITARKIGLLAARVRSQNTGRVTVAQDYAILSTSGTTNTH